MFGSAGIAIGTHFLVTSVVTRHAIQVMTRGTVVLVLSSLAACDSTPSSLDASTVAEPAAPPSALTILPPTTASDFYQTVVSGERGHVVVEVTPITLAQEEIENAARTDRDPSVQSIVQDAGCGNSSFWLYDQFNGTGNRICFVAGGESLDFAYIPRKWRCYNGQCQAYAYWNLNYGSYWPGVNAGELNDDSGHDASLSVIMPFPAWGPRMNFDMSPSQLRQLRLF